MASLYTNTTSLQNAFHIEFNKPLDDRMSHESVASFLINKANPTACPLYKKAYVGMPVSVLSADKSAALLYICKDATPYIFQGDGKQGAADVTEATIGNYWTQMSGGEYKLVKLATANSGMLATYKMQYKAPGKDSFADISGADSIDIPKDYLLKEVHVCKASYSGGKYTETHKQGDSGFDADTNTLCMHFVWNTKDDSETDSDMFIPVQSIIDVDAVFERLDSSLSAFETKMDNKISAAETTFNNLADKVDASCNAVVEKMDEYDEIHANAFIDLNNRITAIEEGGVSTMNSKLTRIQSQVNGLRDEMDEISPIAVNANTVATHLNASVNTAVTIANRNSSTLNNLKPQVEYVVTEVNALKTNKADKALVDSLVAKVDAIIYYLQQFRVDVESGTPDNYDEFVTTGEIWSFKGEYIYDKSTNKIYKKEVSNKNNTRRGAEVSDSDDFWTWSGEYITEGGHDYKKLVFNWDSTVTKKGEMFDEEWSWNGEYIYDKSVNKIYKKLESNRGGSKADTTEVADQDSFWYWNGEFIIEGDKQYYTLAFVWDETVTKKGGERQITPEEVDPADYEYSWKNYIESVEEIENPEYQRVYVDAEDKILWSMDAEGHIVNEDLSGLTTNSDIYTGKLCDGLIDYLEKYHDDNDDFLQLQQNYTWNNEYMYERSTGFIFKKMVGDRGGVAKGDKVNDSADFWTITVQDRGGVNYRIKTFNWKDTEGNDVVFETIWYDFENTWQDIVESVEEVENPEYQRVYVDADDKILWSLAADGTKVDEDLSEATTDNANVSGAKVDALIDWMEDYYTQHGEMPETAETFSWDGTYEYDKETDKIYKHLEGTKGNEQRGEEVAYEGYDLTYFNKTSETVSGVTYDVYTFKWDNTVVFREENMNYDFSDGSWEDLIESTTSEENPEYQRVYVDAEDKILWSMDVDGTVVDENLKSYTTNTEGVTGGKIDAVIDYLESHDLPQVPRVKAYQVFANEECTELPVVGETYTTLYMKMNADMDVDYESEPSSLQPLNKLFAWTEEGFYGYNLYDSKFTSEGVETPYVKNDIVVLNSVSAEGYTIHTRAKFEFGDDVFA